MNQIQIITDAGSDIVDCSRTDLTVLPMTIRFGDEEYLDGVNLTHRQFYEKMIETQVLPTTSQPSPYAFETAIRKIHEQGDIALIITISSKLSGTWQSANIASLQTVLCVAGYCSQQSRRISRTTFFLSNKDG